MGEEYTAQWMVHGLMLSDSPIKQITCDQSNTQRSRFENQNSITKAGVSELVKSGLESIARRADVEIESNELEPYTYHGFKSPLIKINMNGYTIDSNILLSLGSSPECTERRQFKNWSSIYIETRSDSSIPFGDASEYFHQLTQLARELIKGFTDKYCDMQSCDISFPFYFRMIGTEVPEEHPLREHLLLQIKKRSLKHNEISDLIESNSLSQKIWDDVKSVHGDIGDKEYYRLNLGSHDSKEHGKNSIIFMTSIREDGFIYTGFSDMKRANIISSSLDHHPVEQFTQFNEFNGFTVNHDS